VPGLDGGRSVGGDVEEARPAASAHLRALPNGRPGVDEAVEVFPSGVHVDAEHVGHLCDRHRAAEPGEQFQDGAAPGRQAHPSATTGIATNWLTTCRAMPASIFHGPSFGLLQTIPSTFHAYALPTHSDTTDPVDQIIAGARYALAAYGGLANVPGVVAVKGGHPYVGY